MKLSLFDVRDPSRPTEKATHHLQSRWTEVERNHRAFLRDAENEIFFIPTDHGGHVFSYARDTLSLIKTIEGRGIQRAVYIDQYFYIISDSAIRVFEIGSWREVKQIPFVRTYGGVM